MFAPMRLLSGLLAAALTTGCLTESSSGKSEPFNQSIGLEWSAHFQGDYYRLEAVAWTGRNFVAAGSDGTVLTSTDGVAWTYRPLAQGFFWASDISSLAYGGGTLLAAIPLDGALWASLDDGVTWEHRGRPAGVAVEWVTWGDGRFLAFGQDSLGRRFLTSPDGESWTEGATAPAFATTAFWSGSLWVAVGPEAIMTSPDGLVWTSRVVPVGTPQMRGVGRAGANLVIVGEGGLAMTSPDGITWTRGDVGSSPYLVGTAARGGTTLAVGEKIFATYDGVTWSEEPTAFPDGFLAAACGGTRCVAVGGEGIIATSVGGGEWMNQSLHSAPIDPPHLYDIAWSGRLFATVGDNGTLLTSPDGRVWTRRDAGTRERLDRVIASDGAFLVTGGGKILYSKDGTAWASVSNTVGGETPVRANGKWYVFGRSGFMSSSNGTSWTTLYTDDVQGGAEIVWTGALFVAAGGQGHIATSPDGVAWTVRPSGTSSWVHSLFWTGSQLVLVTTASVLTSPDGILWTPHELPESQQDLRGVVWTGNRFVAVGGNGLVLTSPDALEWTTQAQVTSQDLFAIAASRSQAIVVGWNGTILTSP